VAAGASLEMLSLRNLSNVDNGILRLGFNAAAGVLASVDGIVNATANTGALSFKTYSGSAYAEGLYIGSNQRVGIGTNAPATNLDISGNVHIATDPFQAGYPGQTAQLAVMFRYLYGGTTQTTNHIEMGSSRTDNSDYGQTNRYVFATNQTNTGGLDFYINRLQVAAASYTGALTTLTPFTIYRNGNVGINNIAPGYTLDVTGTIRTTAGLVFGVQAV